MSKAKGMGARPTTLEEHILNEYYETREELEITKDQLSMTKRALDAVATELTKIKEIFTKHGGKLDPREKYPYLHMNMSCWGSNDDEYPDYIFLKKYFPVQEIKEEEEKAE